jgi:hypothetical protein
MHSARRRAWFLAPNMTTKRSQQNKRPVFGEDIAEIWPPRLEGNEEKTP